MALSNDLLSQFAKVVTQEKKTSTETIVNGKVIEFTGENGGKYVQLDGSSQLVPLGDTSADVKDGDRVTVLIKDHTATVTGNISTPAASTIAVQNVETVLAEKIQVVNASIVDLEVNKLNAATARIDQLEAKDVEITGTLTAVKADVDELVADKIDVEILDAKYATIENLNTTTAKVGTLEAAHAEFKKATIEDLEADYAFIKNLNTTYANIDFANIGKAAVEELFAKSGIIKELTTGDAIITGELVGVTISGDLIKANTIMAEQLVVRGSDGELYKLSTDFSVLEGVTPVEEDSIHGSNIIANSITAEKISVDDLVAFDATIGGFHITSASEDKAGALYSGVKSSADNTTEGIYMDSEGQLVVSDNTNTNYLKFFKDTDGKYKLDISAESIRFATSKKTVEETIESAVTVKADEITQTVSSTYATKQEVDDIEIGGRNYLTDSNDEQFVNAESRAEFLKTTFDLAPFFDENGLIEVTLSFDAYAPLAGRVQVYCQNGSGARYSFVKTVDVTTEWSRYAVTFTPTGPNEDFEESYLAFYGTYDSGVVPHVRKLKLEIGNKATDWTPAPEDVDGDIAEVKDTADDASTRIGSAESQIKQLSDSIVTVVTDEDGTTRMIQTSTGWEFGTTELQNRVDKTAEDFEELNTYVRIGEYDPGDGKPVEACIDLGVSENALTAKITNTRMEYANGPTPLVAIDSEKQSLEAGIVEVHNYQQFGDESNPEVTGVWQWQRRSNGNLGLSWKEVVN